MALIQSLISNDKYGVKCPYAMAPVGICIHNTANDASAKNEIAYMKSNNNEVSYHIAIDDIESIQVIPFERNSWHAGDGGNGEGNRKYIAIEICYSKSGGDRFIKAEKRAAMEVARLLKKYGWTVDKLRDHRSFSGKNCPHRTNMVDFKYLVQVELNKLNASAPAPSNQLYRVRKSWSDATTQRGAYNSLDNAIAECKKHTGYSVFDGQGNKVYPSSTVSPTPPKPTTNDKRYAENGTFYFNTTVTVRTAPEEGARTNVNYYPGESVKYTEVWTNKNGFNWVIYNRSNGQKGYMKIKNLSNGENYGYAK